MDGRCAMNADRLKLERVSVGYSGRTVIDNLDLSVTRGTCIALVGPNASGKTTLMRAIAGRLAPAGGSIHIDGQPVDLAKPERQDLPDFALPPDELPGFLTVRQCLDIYADAHGQDPAFYSFLRQLQSLRSVVDKNTTLILDTDAAPFALLKNGPSATPSPLLPASSAPQPHKAPQSPVAAALLESR